MHLASILRVVIMWKSSLPLPGATTVTLGLALAMAFASFIYQFQPILSVAQNASNSALDLASSIAHICSPQLNPYPDEAPFLTENGAAMDKMMAGMAVNPTGDVDADFAAMMIPHHQGAIDMAMAELRYGKNEQLRRISQEIIVDQQQEIVAMRLALGQPLPAPMPAPTQPPPSNLSAVFEPSPSMSPAGSTR
jgi:hypothetical protein